MFNEKAGSDLGKRVLFMFATALPLVAPAARTPQSPNGSDLSGNPYFLNVLSHSGIDYVNVSGEPDKPNISGSLGSGAALFDYDEDGDLDLYLVNGAAANGMKIVKTFPNQLYRNQGGWLFEEVTEQAGVGDTGWGFGCATADYDNDGDLDLYVSNFGPNVLYRNQGDGTFVDVTASAQVGDARWGASAAWIDYDRDGDLDLYVTNYVDTSLKKIPLPGSSIVHAPGLLGDIYCRFKEIEAPVFCGPTGLVGASDVFYRNDGDGTFSEATEASGLYDRSQAYSLGVIVLDYNEDGYPDIYVANDAVANHLFMNRGGGKYEEVGLSAGVSHNEFGRAEGSMGLATGDINGDGKMDLFVTNYSHETNTLYIHSGGDHFADRTDQAFPGRPSYPYLSWATRFMDLDLDGDEDLFVANGHVFPQVDLGNVGTTYRQRNQIFWNDGAGGFTEVGFLPDDGMSEVESSRGGAFGDIDNDGHWDAAIVNIDTRPSLLRNTGTAARGRHWIGFRLIGRASDRDALGARLTLESGGKRQIREVGPAGSFLSSNDGRVHFGLGENTTVELVRIRWPKGGVQELFDLGTDRYHIIVEPR